MTFKDHFSSVSDSYSKHRPSYPKILYDFILQNVARNDHAWDCATGNGQAAVALAQYFDRVSATDASEAQISKAQKHQKITYKVAPAENSGLPDSSIDLVTVAQALHWFDFEKFYREVRRVAKEQAIIAAWSYGLLSTGKKPIDNTIYEFYKEIVGPYWPPERTYIDKKYLTIPFPFYEIRSPTFHMTIHHSLQSVLDYFSTWSAVKNYKKQLNRDPLIGMAEKLKPHWKKTHIEVKIPIYLRLGRVKSS